MVRSVGGPEQPPKNEDAANVKMRDLVVDAETITARIFPSYKKGVDNDALYKAATSKKGVTASVLKGRVELQSSKTVTRSSTVSSTLRQIGKQIQTPARPVRKSGGQKKHY